MQYNYRMTTALTKSPAAEDWASFVDWLDTLPPLKDGVQPGMTDLEGRSGGGKGDEVVVVESEGEEGGGEEEGGEEGEGRDAKRMRVM